jgi:hypothetical protein
MSQCVDMQPPNKGACSGKEQAPLSLATCHSIITVS